MKIVYFHQGLFPSTSPSSGFIINTLSGFVQAGAEITLLTVRNSDKPLSHILSEDFALPPDLPVELLNCGLFRRWHWYIYRKAYRILLQQDCDILITRNLGFLPYALRLKAKTGCRVYFEAHDFFTDLSLRPDSQRRRSEHARDKRYLPLVDGIICVSKGLADLFESYYPQQRVLAAMTGIRPTDSPVHATVSKRICYTGSFFTAHYNLLLLLNTIKLVKMQGVKLLLAGVKNEVEQNRLTQLVASLQVGNRVEVLPWQSPKALSELLQQCDLGLCPLRESFLTRYSAPTKITDYLAAGLPVVATDLQSIREMFGRVDCLLTCESDPLAWAQALDALYQSPERFAVLSADALNIANGYTWKHRAQKILSFIR